MKRARIATMVGTLLLASLHPPEAGAQIRVVPRVGLYVPANGVGRVSTTDGVRDLRRRPPSLGLGGDLELGPPDRTSFRLSALYGTAADVPVAGVGCEAEACGGRSALVTVTGSVALRPLPARRLIQPYLLLGGGVKRYAFEFAGGSGIPEGLVEAAIAGQIGVGMEWTLGILRGVVQLSDLVGGSVVRAEGEGGIQHDLFVTLGLTLG